MDGEEAWTKPLTFWLNNFIVALGKIRVRIEITFGLLGCSTCQERVPPVTRQPPDVVDPIPLYHSTGEAITQQLF